MSEAWLDLAGRLLRPNRPDIDRCLREREAHLVRRRRIADERAHAIAACERRIESARAEVFAADDGVVGARMTELEREWRRLSKVDPEAGLMDLWAAIAPPSWMDRKMWRDSAACARVDAATALAADVEGVEAVQRAAIDLRAALATWGTDIAAPVRWAHASSDLSVAETLFADVLRAVQAEPVAAHVVRRAQRLAAQVHDLVRGRCADRPALARDVAQAAYVDCMLHATRMDRTCPVKPLRAIWRAGYTVASVDRVRGITLEIPPL